MRRAAHRPKRSYFEAPIHRSHVSLEKCPFCGSRLISAGSREVDKYVQALNNSIHVIGYGRKCSNPDCPQPQARYHATQADKLSLPYVTYGLDVMAYSAHRRNGEASPTIQALRAPGVACWIAGKRTCIIFTTLKACRAAIWE